MRRGLVKKTDIESRRRQRNRAGFFTFFFSYNSLYTKTEVVGGWGLVVRH